MPVRGWLLGLVLACCACAGDDEAAPRVTPETSVGVEVALGGELGEFVARVAEPGEVAFTARYAVLRKLGGEESSVEVAAEPPSWRLRVGDVIVVDGPRPATCRVDARRCIGEVREQVLATTGVFSRFFATAPKDALATDARRSGAGEPVFSERTVAGLTLVCAGVPIAGTPVGTYCLTAEGVFGYVDTPAVRYELISYSLGPPDEPVVVPYELTPDDDFLTRD